MSYADWQRVEIGLLVFEPVTFFPRYLKSIDDVAALRSQLRNCEYCDFAIEYLTHLVFARVLQSRRKNLLYGLQAIKWVLRNRSGDSLSISASTVDRLFELYQHFVFDRLDDIRWCVSAILKDKPLRPAQIRWLLDHHQDSEHIVNRLLRYPKFDLLIAEWARKMIGTHKLTERTSELLGRLIVDDLPPEARQLPTAAVYWAIYYSSAELESKRRLLERCASTDALDDLIEISLRLKSPGVLRRVLTQKAAEQRA